MGRALLEAAQPQMWAVEGERAQAQGASGRAIRFGRHRIAISDIDLISLEEVRTRNVKGLVTAAAVFMCAASVLTYFVFEQGAMLRFLFGAGILATMALAGLHEAAKMKKISHYELTITLKDGRKVVFTSADRDDIQALALRLAAEQG